MENLNRLLTAKEAAKLCGYSEKTFRKMRCKKSKNPGPRFIKVGRSIRYRIDDLEEWLGTSLRESRPRK